VGLWWSFSFFVLWWGCCGTRVRGTVRHASAPTAFGWLRGGGGAVATGGRWWRRQRERVWACPAPAVRGCRDGRSAAPARWVLDCAAQAGRGRRRPAGPRAPRGACPLSQRAPSRSTRGMHGSGDGIAPTATSIGPAVGGGLLYCGGGGGGHSPRLALAVLGAWAVGCGPAAECGRL